MNYPFPFQEKPEKIEEIIGQKISFFSSLVKDEKPYSSPLISWIKTENGIWYRFIIDAWMLHYTGFQEGEHEEYLEEDFENGKIEIANESWMVRDLMKTFNLEGKTITEAELTYFQQEKLVCCQLQIKINEELDIRFKDYGDHIPAELSITKAE